MYLLFAIVRQCVYGTYVTFDNSVHSKVGTPLVSSVYVRSSEEFIGLVIFRSEKPPVKSIALVPSIFLVCVAIVLYLGVLSYTLYYVLLVPS